MPALGRAGARGGGSFPRRRSPVECRSIRGRNVEHRSQPTTRGRRRRFSTLTQAARETRVPMSNADMARLLRTVPLLMMVVALAHFNRIGISVAGNERIVHTLGDDTEKMGQVYSAFLLLYTLAMLPGGWFIDRFGPRVALMVLCFGSTVFVATDRRGRLPGRRALGALAGAHGRAVVARPGQRPAASGGGPDGLRTDSAELQGDGEWTGHRRRLRGDRLDVLRLRKAHRSLRLADRLPDLRRPDLDRRIRVDTRDATLRPSRRIRPLGRASISRPCGRS